VVYGLLRNRLLCPFREAVNSVITSGHKLDGSTCDNIDALKTTRNSWAVCDLQIGE